MSTVNLCDCLACDKDMLDENSIDPLKNGVDPIHGTFTSPKVRFLLPPSSTSCNVSLWTPTTANPLSCRTLHVGSIPLSVVLSLPWSAQNFDTSIEMTLRDFQKYLEQCACLYNNAILEAGNKVTMNSEPSCNLCVEVSLYDFIMNGELRVVEQTKADWTEEIQVNDSSRSAVLVRMEQNDCLEVQTLHTYEDLVPPSLLNASFDHDDMDSVTVDMNESCSSHPFDDNDSFYIISSADDAEVLTSTIPSLVSTSLKSDEMIGLVTSQIPPSLLNASHSSGHFDALKMPDSENNDFTTSDDYLNKTSEILSGLNSHDATVAPRCIEDVHLFNEQSTNSKSSESLLPIKGGNCNVLDAENSQSNPAFVESFSIGCNASNQSPVLCAQKCSSNAEDHEKRNQATTLDEEGSFCNFPEKMECHGAFSVVSASALLFIIQLLLLRLSYFICYRK